MLIDTSRAAYLLAVTTAIDEGKLSAEQLTATCPECEEQPEPLDNNDTHLVAKVPGGGTAVVVGCEGYWLVNPALVGIDAPNWQPLPEPTV